MLPFEDPSKIWSVRSFQTKVTTGWSHGRTLRILYHSFKITRPSVLQLEFYHVQKLLEVSECIVGNICIRIYQAGQVAPIP